MIYKKMAIILNYKINQFKIIKATLILRFKAQVTNYLWKMIKCSLKNTEKYINKFIQTLPFRKLINHKIKNKKRFKGNKNKINKLKKILCTDNCL